MIKLTRSNVVKRDTFHIWVNEQSISMIEPEPQKGTIITFNNGIKTIVDESIEQVASLIGCTDPLKEEANVNPAD